MAQLDLKKWALATLVSLEVIRRERASDTTQKELVETSLTAAFKIASNAREGTRESALKEIELLLPKLEKLGGKVGKWRDKLEALKVL